MSAFAGIGGNAYYPYGTQGVLPQDAQQKDASEKHASAMDEIADWKETLYQKLVNGETEEAYAIGGASYTQAEWEKLLTHFDTLSEAMREASRAEFEKREEKAQELRVREKAAQEKENQLSWEKERAYYKIFLEKLEAISIS